MTARRSHRRPKAPRPPRDRVEVERTRDGGSVRVVGPDPIKRLERVAILGLVLAAIVWVLVSYIQSTARANIEPATHSTHEVVSVP